MVAYKNRLFSDSEKIRKVRISEKFRDHIFQCQKLTQKNEILTFFAYAIFEKVQNSIHNLRVG